MMQIYLGTSLESEYNDHSNGALQKEMFNAECFHTTMYAKEVINVFISSDIILSAHIMH